MEEEEQIKKYAGEKGKHVAQKNENVSILMIPYHFVYRLISAIMCKCQTLFSFKSIYTLSVFILCYANHLLGVFVCLNYFVQLLLDECKVSEWSYWKFEYIFRTKLNKQKMRCTNYLVKRPSRSKNSTMMITVHLSKYHLWQYESIHVYYVLYNIIEN